VCERLLPLDAQWRRRLEAQPWPTRQYPQMIGGPVQALADFLREYLFVSLYRACAESLASENANRLAAMQRAEKNIGDLLEQLTRTFHRTRQNRIDDELFDLVSGFEALSRARP
jgi:F-type H+-transporting ATPase subunit gamma